MQLGITSGLSRESKQINALLDEIKASIHKFYHEMQRRGSVVTAEKIKNEFLDISERHDTLLDLFRKHNEDVKQLIGVTKSAAIYQKYEVTRKHLQAFIETKYKVSDISLLDVNHMFITDFEVYLLTAGKCNKNTTAKFMQFFKRIILIALNNGLIVNDPFANYKIRIQKVDRCYLTEEEVTKILKKKFTSERLEHVRDIFVFSCFTGLAYIDVKNLTQANVRTSCDGNLWIKTKRQKTNVEVNVPLLKIPQMIIEKYKGKLAKEMLLPVLSNQKTNSYLKEIGDLCGIDKKLTFHLARHTFATTTTLAKGIPIETVSKMLGHTNIEITQIYARITNRKISKDMESLAGKFTGAEKIYKETSAKNSRKN